VIINKEIDAYCENHSSKSEVIFDKILEYATQNNPEAHMLSGRLQGDLIAFLVRISNPINVLEIGTFLGYATLKIAHELSENASLITIENNPEYTAIAQGFINKTNIKNKITILEGSAVEILPKLNLVWDFVFIDADKKNNENYYELALKNTRIGGLILIDNMLWKGKVIEESKDKRTAMIDEFNKKLAQDKRVKALLLPIRDGLFLLQKL
jgi:predicted O-methyltransferase YrrM